MGTSLCNENYAVHPLDGRSGEIHGGMGHYVYFYKVHVKKKSRTLLWGRYKSSSHRGGLVKVYLWGMGDTVEKYYGYDRLNIPLL